MNKLKAVLMCLSLAIGTSVYAGQAFKTDQSFGAEMPVGGETISLKQAIASLATAGEHMVKIQGQITEVCQAKGCWMILVDGDTYARVTFEDYGFFVPMETSMQRTVVYGVLTEQVLSGEQAQHFAQDAGAKSVVKQQGEIKEYSIVARAVQLENRS